MKTEQQIRDCILNLLGKIDSNKKVIKRMQIDNDKALIQIDILEWSLEEPGKDDSKVKLEDL